MTNKKYKCFDLNVSDNIANLVLSRPNELNTMSRDFWVELGSILEEINRNSDIRVVVMSSTGKHFCAGMDLSAFSNGVEDIPDDKKPDSARIGEALYRVAKELQGYISNLEKITQFFFSSRRKIISKKIKKILFNDQINQIKEIDLNMRPSDIKPETYFKITKLFETN